MSFADLPQVPRSYHPDGSVPEVRSGVVFVFGSNLAGRHGKGAALLARELFGAVYGQGEGLQGQSYGVATKDQSLRRRSLNEIYRSAQEFCDFTLANPGLQFFVTGVGCGYAGYEASQIAPFFARAVNCSFPAPWRAHLGD